MSLVHDLPNSSIHTSHTARCIGAFLDSSHELLTALAAAFWFGTLAIYDPGTTSFGSMKPLWRKGDFCMAA
jgi:hypothetical protein